MQLFIGTILQKLNLKACDIYEDALISINKAIDFKILNIPPRDVLIELKEKTY